MNLPSKPDLLENIQALREAVKANLATQSKAHMTIIIFAKLMEKIKEIAVIKYPPQVVDHEVEHVMEDLKSRLVEQNIDMATYLNRVRWMKKSSLQKKRDLSQ